MKEKTMIFRAGTQDIIWGVQVETAEVEAADVDGFLADGWYRSPLDVADADEEQHANAQAELDNAEAERIKQEVDARLAAQTVKENEDRDALIAKAQSLGVAVDGRWSVQSIKTAIDQASAVKTVEPSATGTETGTPMDKVED